MNEAARASIKRVLDAISDPPTKSLAAELLRLSLHALQDLEDLDESLYTCYSIQHSEVKARENLPATLAEVRERTFQGIRELTAFLTANGLLGDDDDPTLPNGLASGEFGEEEFDFGEEFDLVFDEDTLSQNSPSHDLSGLDEFDIDEAFESIAEDNHDNIHTKIEDFRQHTPALAFAFQQQLQNFEERIARAFLQQNNELIIRELDASRESLTEGLFALATTVFQVFSSEIERSTLLPGYKDALERSLLIRRGIAELTRMVNAENDWIQDDSLPERIQLESVERIIGGLRLFMESEIFHSMRVPDRLELVNFLQQLQIPRFRDAKLACEGLSKYLESLSIINQREVLIQHDQELIQQIHQSLEAARSLLMISVPGARAMVDEALLHARKLDGRNPTLDDQLSSWQQKPSLFESKEALEKIIQRLTDLLR